MLLDKMLSFWLLGTQTQHDDHPGCPPSYHDLPAVYVNSVSTQIIGHDDGTQTNAQSIQCSNPYLHFVSLFS